MSTRDHIITTALALFNQRGTAPVSTNHIAEAAGISPGNLYYHFRNKEEIIRAICERLFATRMRCSPCPTTARPASLTSSDSCGPISNRVEYAFVYREILALLLHDPPARTLPHGQAARLRGIRDLIGVFGAAGVLQPDLNPAITALADLCWLISESWLTALELRDRPADDDHMQRGIDLMLFTFARILPIPRTTKETQRMGTRTTGIAMILVDRIQPDLLRPGQRFRLPGHSPRASRPILRRFDDGGAELVALWYAFAFTALLAVPLALLLYGVFAASSPPGAGGCDRRGPQRPGAGPGPVPLGLPRAVAGRPLHERGSSPGSA